MFADLVPIDPEVIAAILKSLPAPAITALVVLAVTHARKERPVGARWAAGLAVGGGTVVGYWLAKLGGWPVPPTQFRDWIPITGVLAVVAALVLAMPLKGWMVWAGRAVFSAAVVTGLSWKMLHNEAARMEASAWVAGLSAGMVAAWGCLQWLVDASGRKAVNVAGFSRDEAGAPAVERERVVPAWTGPVVMGAWAGMVAQALAATDSLLLGQVAGIVGATCGAAAIVSLFRPRLTMTGGGAGAMVLLMGALIFAGHHYAGLSALWMAGMLMLAPVFAWGVDVVLLRKMRGWKRGVLRVAAVCVLPAAVLAVVLPAAMKAAESSGGY